LVESLLPECPALCVVPHLGKPNNHLKLNQFLKKLSTNLERNRQNFFLTNPRKYVNCKFASHSSLAPALL
jgi:hypothetical protein